MSLIKWLAEYLIPMGADNIRKGWILTHYSYRMEKQFKKVYSLLSVHIHMRKNLGPSKKREAIPETWHVENEKTNMLGISTTCLKSVP